MAHKSRQTNATGNSTPFPVGVQSGTSLGKFSETKFWGNAVPMPWKSLPVTQEALDLVSSSLVSLYVERHSGPGIGKHTHPLWGDGMSVLLL